MNTLVPTLIINEVFPNPSSGSEWVEILNFGDKQFFPEEYKNFTISDNKRIIYQFSGNENCLDNLLIVELSGLNNDGDSVILKNVEGELIDEMTYTSSQKDLSWLRTDIENSSFVLGEPSPLALNVIPTPINEATVTPSNTPSPTISPIPTINEAQNQETEKKLELDQTDKITIKQKEILNKQDILEKYFGNYQNFKNLKIDCQNTQDFPKPRLVFLGQRILKTAIVNAIIGSSLLIIAAVLLSYEQNHQH